MVCSIELLADLACLHQREVVSHSVQRLEEERGPAADQPGNDSHDILSTVDSEGRQTDLLPTVDDGNPVPQQVSLVHEVSCEDYRPASFVLDQKIPYCTS